MMFGKKAIDFNKLSEEVRKDLLLNSEDVIQMYKVIIKSSNTNIKGEFLITQNYFCFKSQYDKKILTKIQISSIKEMTKEIKIIDFQGRIYYFVPQEKKEECYNFLYYMFKFPFSVLDLNIYKQPTFVDDSVTKSTRFDFDTAQEALYKAEETKRIKEENNCMLEQQQKKIETIDQLLGQTEVHLGQIDDSIKATKSLVYELKLRYTKTRQSPDPKVKVQVLQEQIKESPPKPVQVQVLWELENDDLVPAVMNLFDEKIDFEELSTNKKKALNRTIYIKDVIGLFMRARPLYLKISLNQQGKENRRVRLCATCLQFIVNEIYIRHLKIVNKQVCVTFEPNSRVFDYGDVMITKTFMNCTGVKGQINFTEDEDIALKILSPKEQEEYLRMKKINQTTVGILDGVSRLNVETTRMAGESINQTDRTTKEMEKQTQRMKESKPQCEEILKK